MSNEEDYKMSLEDVIKKRLKKDKTGKLRSLMRKRRRKFFHKTNYDDSKSKKDSRRRIRVENLNKEMQNTDLVKLFEKYGTLTRCGIKFDKMGVSKGIADVEYATHEECQKAINILDNAEISGEKIRVKYASRTFGKYSKRGRSAGKQRRNLKKLNRLYRRGISSSKRKTRTVNIRIRASDKTNIKLKRRYFLRTLGKKRKEKK